MGAMCCNTILGDSDDNYDQIVDDWDQTDAEKSYSGKNRGLKSGGGSSVTKTENKGNLFNVKKLLFDVDTVKFLDHDVYFNKQEPDLVTKDYKDSEFPPGENSLIFLNDAATDVTAEELAQLKVFKWKRVGELLKKGYGLYDKIEIEDIHQGSIGNCYFLSALSAVAEFQERFDKIFVTKEKPINGCYQVRLVLQGIPEIVCVDDYFPCQDNWFAGATSGNKEIWVQVLEKAWAKVNGSYASTIAGLPGEALAALTEAPVVSYIHRKYPDQRKNELWKIIKESDSRNYILCTNTGNNSDAQKMGLVESHAYTIISAYEEQNIKLVKLRNPWGQFEWKGDFSDKSPRWEEFPGLKDRVGFLNKDDGIFYMTFEDFLTYYPYTFICKYENGFHYNLKKVEQLSNDHMVATKIIIKNKTKIAIGLHQKQQRFYSKVKGYKTQMARIILAKFNSNDNTYTFVNSDSNDNDKLYIECEALQPGEYHIFSNINWTYETKCRYSITTYASEPVEIKIIEKENIPTDFLVQILGSYLTQNSPMNKMNESAFYQISNNDNDTGFYMAYFHNNSDNEGLKVNFSSTYNDKCSFSSTCQISDKNSSTQDKFTNESFSFVVAPNQKQMLIWRLLANPWIAKFQPSQLSCQLISGYSEYLKTDPIDDKYRNFIEESLNSKTHHKENLSLDCFYSELDIEDGVLVIFENKSNSTFRFKITFPNTQNLEIIHKNPRKILFNVPAGNFSYVRLRKIDENKEYHYNINYSFKKY